MRAWLYQAAGHSRGLTWLLACAAAVIGVSLGLVIRGASGGAAPSAPAAASNQAEQLRLAESSQPGLRVLFVGNSFTAANSLPDMVRRLAAGQPKPRRIFAAEYDPGGSRLQIASADEQLRSLLQRVHWNLVVLQEQSQLPTLPYWLQTSTLPALHALDAAIRAGGARPLLFETWGYQHGDRINQPTDDYLAMQTRLHSGYSYLAQQESVPVAAVGDAWALALQQRPTTPLWAPDGKHPSVEGSYLAAVVIAATVLSSLSPGPLNAAINSSYTAGLDQSTATWLQQVGLTTANRSQGGQTTQP